jgi:hypothetical protein
MLFSASKIIKFERCCSLIKEKLRFIDRSIGFMEIVTDLLKILLPAAVVLYAMFLTVKSFLQKDIYHKQMEVKMKNTETVLPIRLQAYERICLLLERIMPNNLILRINDSSYSARQLHHLLLSDMREEFNHNLSQQVYMSDEAWSLVKNAVESLTSEINKAAQEVDGEAKSIELAKKIMENWMQREQDPVAYALSYIKQEIRASF